MNDASFENDLKNGSNAAATSKFIDEELKNCKESLDQSMRDECETSVVLSSQQSFYNLNISGSSFTLNYSESSEENEEKNDTPIDKSQIQPLKNLNSIGSWGKVDA